MEEIKWTAVLKPKNKLFDFHLKEVWKYRELIFLFVKRDFVTKYKQTILGPAWAIIQPLLTTLVFTFVFGNIAGLAPGGIPSFLFYLCGNMAWGYFAGCLTGTAGTFTGNAAIFGKVYFPRLVSPIANVFSNLINFSIQMLFFVVAAVIYWLIGQPLNVQWWYLLTIPLILLQMATLGLGLGIIISALTTKYRDLTMLVGFGVSLWMYATPVAYGIQTAQEHLSSGLFKVYMLNPTTNMVELFKYAFMGPVGGSVNWLYYGISWILTLVLLFIGLMLFSRVEKTFIDTV